MAVNTHPFYSPDLAPCCCSSSQERNHSNKGSVFRMSIKCSNNNHYTIPHAIPKGQFQWCFQESQKCWTHCINLEGVTLQGPLTNNKVKRIRSCCLNLGDSGNALIQMNCEYVKSVILYVLIIFHNLLLLPAAWKINYNLQQVHTAHKIKFWIFQKNMKQCVKNTS